MANTARSGFNRANTFRSARQIQEGEAEELHYKYVGPPPERPFCQKHLGEVCSKSEIDALDNGQGLPVDVYAGGYNCRHRWVLASDEEAEAARRRKREAEANAGAGGASGGGGGGNANEEDRMLYRNEETGGTLHLESDRSPSDSERYAGRVLADEGRTVRLLRRSEAQGVKSYDADVDSEPWEFKELMVPGERRPENAIYQGLRAGKYQNNGQPLWLLYHIHEGQRKNIASIASAVSDAVRRDQNQLIRGVTLVFDDATTIHRTRAQINEGTGF